MLPPFLGALLLLGTIGFVAVALVVALIALLVGKPVIFLRSMAAGGVMAGIFALFWVLGLLLAPTRVLSPGQAVSFCGLDCHLHVSVAGVRPGDAIGVTVQFASDARRAPEWPGRLKFRLRDIEGREFAPLNAVPDVPLEAGSASTWELQFPGEARLAGAVLIVTWKDGLDLLVPGAGNPLVQRRKRLALPGPGAGV